jgi:hypothetical protein
MVNCVKIGSIAALVSVVAVSAPVFATPTSSGAAVPLAASVVSAPAVAGDAILTFSEFPVGTVITTQYAADGIVFSALTGNAPIIANDGAMPDSPVLSPNPPFAGDFQWMFPSGASGVQFDSGSWNNLGTGVIDVFNTSNVLVAALTNTTTGVDHFDLSSLVSLAVSPLTPLATRSAPISTTCSSKSESPSLRLLCCLAPVWPSSV